MNRITTLICFVLLLNTTLLDAQPTGPVEMFAGDTAFRHASISISFRNLATGEVEESLNGEMALGSASVMKLVTTAAALEILGPQFTFKTRVGYTGTVDRSGSLKGFLVIRGGGDPALGSEYFTDHYGDYLGKWREAIKKAGINRVEGRVIADASLFDYFPAPGGWSWSDLGNYYGAGAHGLSVNDNIYRIHFTTGQEGTIPVITSIEPEIPDLIIKNLLKCSGDSDRGFVYIEPYGNYAEVRGTIPVNREDFILKASMPDPPYFISNEFDRVLRNDGIEITAPPSSMRIFDISAGDQGHNSAVVLVETTSPPLSEIIRVTNTESVNLFAEHLLRMIGTETGSKEGWDMNIGIKAVYAFLDSAGVGSDGLYMTDGSGLSRYDALSSDFVTRLLEYEKNRSLSGGYFVSSLASAGENGTLQYYFRDEVFKGRLLAKSGTSTRIRNYAGYLKTKSGKEYAFAILVNNFDCTPTEVTQRVEKLLKDIINAEKL